MFPTQGVLALSINIIGTLSDFIIAVIAQLGYMGVFAGMTLESVGLPIPSEVIMTFGGYRVGRGADAYWRCPCGHVRLPCRLSHSLLHRPVGRETPAPPQANT